MKAPFSFPQILKGYGNSGRLAGGGSPSQHSQLLRRTALLSSYARTR